jgi:tetratricopeptide (TPR) repeat protein
MNLKNYHYYLLDAFILVCLVVAVYGKLVGYSFQTAWDDNVYIVNNAVSHGFSWEHVKTVFDVGACKTIGQYNPLSMLSFMLDFTIWRGLNPEGYHLTNIVIHTFNGMLVYYLLMRLHGERLLALVATALFLIHPVQVESVGWIAERKGLLSLFFMLLAWLWYCRYQAAEKGTGRLAYSISLVAFLFSLLAKTSSVVLPLILMIFDYCFKKNDRRLSLPDKIPFFAIAGVFSAIELFAGKHGGSTVGYHGGSPLATFYTMLPVFCRYLKLLLWPSGLNIEHLPPVYRSPELVVIGAALLLAVLATASYRLFKANTRLGFWILFFWTGLLPVSQIFPQILLMYEHYLYMPIIGVGALAGYGVTCLRDRFSDRRVVLSLLYACLALWVLALAVTAHQRTAVWKDSLALFTDATAKSPNGVRVWQTLGEAYRFVGNNEASRVAMERALKLKPDSTDVLWALAEIHTERGELDKGYAYLQKLFAINPNYVMGWATLGNNYLIRGNHGKAKEMYNKALAMQPDALQVLALLGKLAIIEKHFDEARGYFNKIEADPRKWKLAENAYQMVRTEALAGRVDEAIAWLEKALYRGYPDYYTLNRNMELAPIWDSPRFVYLMQEYFPEEEGSR